LAKELATLDVLSRGRLEIGIGAGWMSTEYDKAGLSFDRASVRIERLEEYVTVLKGLFADEPLHFSGRHYAITDLSGTPKPLQRPHPPIMIGGGGPRVLSLAACHADIISIITAPHSDRHRSRDANSMSPGALEERIRWIEQAAGDRLEDVELNFTLAGIGIAKSPEAGAAAFRPTLQAGLEARGLTFDLGVADLLDSPAFAFGSVGQIAEKILALRERYGITYVTLGFGAPPDAFAPVLEQLRDA
jgi:probable F420-dependent oxidoreductase